MIYMHFYFILILSCFHNPTLGKHAFQADQGSILVILKTKTSVRSEILPTLFQIYLTIIRHYGISSVQYAHDTQLYISNLEEINDSLDIFSWCLEAQQISVEPCKMEWLWMGPVASRSLLSLVLDGVALASQLLLKLQVAAVASSAFCSTSYCVPITPFLNREALCLVTHALVICHLDYCNTLYMGYP